MAPKPAEAGKSFMEQVLAKVPEDRRAALAPHVQAILAEDALLSEIGGGALRQDEFSRKMNEATAELTRLAGVETQQKTWFAVNSALLEKARKAGMTAEGDPALDPNADPAHKPVAGAVTLDDVNKLLDQRERGVVPFVGEVATLAVKHFQTFGEVLDTGAILRDAATKNITLDAAYRLTHGERLTTKAQEAENARIDKIVQTRLAEERRTERSRPPDAIGGGSPLDVLEPAKAGVGVDELVDFYEAEVAKSRGATAG